MARRSSWKNLKIHILIIILFIAYLILFPIALVLCLPVYLFRFIVAMARKVFRPDLGKMVTTRSAVIATDNPSENPQWPLCVWLVLEGQFDFETFIDNFYANIVLKKDSNGNLLNPEYQQFFKRWLGFLFWKWEHKFNIRDHMRYYNSDKEKSTLTTEEDLKEIIKKLTAKPFETCLSPWEFLFIPNYLQPGDSSPQKSILILRVHHGFCDGFAILWLLLKEVNHISMENVAKPVKVTRSFLSRLIRAITFWIRGPYDFMKLIVKSNDHNQWHLPRDKLERPFNTAFTQRIPLDYIKAIRKSNEVSFTSVVMSGLTGGLRKKMLQKGIKIPLYVTTAVAVPMPGHPNKLRNHFIFSFMQLPVGIPDPKKRLQKVERNFQKLKRSPVTLLSFLMIPIFGGLFTWMIKLFTSNDFSTVLTSNFPGPPETTYFIGGGGSNKVLDMNFAAGLGVGSVGIGFCMMSYDQGMRIISSVDKSILDSDEEVEELNSMILEELELLSRSQEV